MADRITSRMSMYLRDLLTASPLSYADLVQYTGISQPRVARWVKGNRADIRVVSWSPDKNGRLFCPVFRWGAGADAPRPGRVLTAAAQMRKSRAGGTHGGARQNSGPVPTPLNIRRVLALRTEGFSYRDIGARLGLSAATIRNAVLRHERAHANSTN